MSPLLIIHEALALFLLYTCFCRQVKMTLDTERAIRLAFWGLAIAAVISVGAPFRGWEPDWVHVIMLIAINTVQFTTATYWRRSMPETFKQDGTRAR